MLLVTRSSSAHPNDGNGDNAGHARVFTLTDGVWVQVGADIDGENADDYVRLVGGDECCW